MFLDAFWKPSTPAVAHAAVTFESSARPTLLTHSVSSYRDDATGLVDQLTAALPACGRFTSVPDGGAFTTSARPVPALGERSAAVRVQSTLGSLAVTFDLVMVARGHTLVVVHAGGAAPLDRGTLDAVTRRAVAKVG